MIDTVPPNTQFHSYQRPTVVPARERISRRDELAGVLRSLGVPELTVERISAAFDGVGIVVPGLRRFARWARRHPVLSGSVLLLIAGILFARGSRS